MDVHEIRTLLERSLKKMRKGKTCDEDALVAGRLQTGSKKLLQSIADLFSDLFSGRAEPLEQWRTTKLVILSEKAAVTLSKNYKPIAIIPVLRTNCTVASCFSA